MMELKEVFELIEYIDDIKNSDYDRLISIEQDIEDRLMDIEASLNYIEQKIMEKEDDDNDEELPLD